MNVFIRWTASGCAALAAMAGILALLAIVSGAATSTLQETTLATIATALFALSLLLIVGAGLTYLEDLVNLLKDLDTRDQNFKAWQAQQVRPTPAPIQYPAGGLLNQK
jgi:hypothetical protein